MEKKGWKEVEEEGEKAMGGKGGGGGGWWGGGVVWRRRESCMSGWLCGFATVRSRVEL